MTYQSATLDERAFNFFWTTFSASPVFTIRHQKNEYETNGSRVQEITGGIVALSRPFNRFEAAGV
ncbi:MAG: hypothetical protein EBT07_11630 [Actinobacteria bacterium]|nr:hypothetical protein [Actinomycetota bacterium]